MTADQWVDLLVAEGGKWTLEQQRIHRPAAQPLEPQLLAELGAFFDKDILESVRFAEVEQLPNPGFYHDLERMGLAIPLDFSQNHAVTFIDTVLLSKRFQAGWTRGLYFHEMVHAVQFSILRLDGFMKRYIRGWAENGKRYRAIPLEEDAFDLQERYEGNPLQPFSVRELVLHQLGMPSAARC